MKSIEVIVPRRLISEFFPHPEYYGDFVVKLKNGMYTDLYYREEAEFITITNDEELIEYLDSQLVLPMDYIFRNGVFAFRKIEQDDQDLMKLWTSPTIILEDKLKCYNEIVHSFPEKFIATFYWIEFGTVDFIYADDELIIKLEVYDVKWIDNLDVEICIKVLIENFKN